MAYRVADDILEDQIQLPDVKPEYLIVAKMIKYILTGHLNADIKSTPPFPGKEDNYLELAS